MVMDNYGQQRKRLWSLVVAHYRFIKLEEEEEEEEEEKNLNISFNNLRF